MQLVLLQSVFQLAVERFGLYMLLQGLGRVHTAQRAVEPLSLDGGVGGDRSTYLPDMTLLVNSPPITIDLRLKARQPAVSFSASLPKLLEWESLGLMYASKDHCVRKEVRHPASHSQCSIYAGCWPHQCARVIK